MRITRRTLFGGALAAAPVTAADSNAEWLPTLPGARAFEGDALRELAFPLGALGTGTVSLGGHGDLHDWEIFNRRTKAVSCR